jgi:hypothetical protein
MARHLYYSNFHSWLNCGILLWDGDNESNKMFKLDGSYDYTE